MCGRFDLNAPLSELLDWFGGLPPAELDPRYNVAPSQEVTAIRWTDLGKRTWCRLRWGLIPHWAKDEKIGYKMINARAETIAEKPAYRGPFAHSRCLIPATGFYEWKATNGTHKQPYRIMLRSQEPFAFAALWSTWHDVQSCSIVTTRPNELVAEIHDRMPVILPPDLYDTWLDPQQGRDTLQQLLKPYPAAKMEAYPVSTLVNSPRNDTPECIVPVET